jgi:hypothetical protein
VIASAATSPDPAPVRMPECSFVQTGEAKEALFRQLVVEHRHRLYRFVVKHIGWSTDAEDLTQQAFVQAAQSYETFKGESELSTWLYERRAGSPGCNRVSFSKRPPAS